MVVKTKKKKATKETTKKVVKKTTKKVNKESFIQVVGRRRVASARVRLYPHKKGKIIVNDLPIEEYFPGKIMEQIYLTPLKACNAVDKYLITIKVVGSGKMGQLGAVSHGISRALLKLDEELRPILKKRGLLTRDPRKKERRKAGTGGKSRRQKQSPRR